ncbi:hypothetical protein VNO80_11060 [Phaseolus coccineus]|uniref:Uncharacterized protein n=1 Tax=Phaseolus coccineus TaxID=3886 RepID=A0AAN9NAY8_PHACN
MQSSNCHAYEGTVPAIQSKTAMTQPHLALHSNTNCFGNGAATRRPAFHSNSRTTFSDPSSQVSSSALGSSFSSMRSFESFYLSGCSEPRWFDPPIEPYLYLSVVLQLPVACILQGMEGWIKELEGLNQELLKQEVVVEEDLSLTKNKLEHSEADQ